VSDDGNLALVAAQEDVNGNGIRKGSIYVFPKNGDFDGKEELAIFRISLRYSQ